MNLVTFMLYFIIRGVIDNHTLVKNIRFTSLRRVSLRDKFSM